MWDLNDAFIFSYGTARNRELGLVKGNRKKCLKNTMRYSNFLRLIVGQMCVQWSIDNNLVFNCSINKK